MKLDSYKITALGIMPKRRETLDGAKKLADKLSKQGKHGMIEEVWFDDHNLYFEKVQEF